MSRLKELMELNNVEEKTTERIVHISREEFSLLDATADNTIYYIAEDNGTVTMIKGDNR